MEMLSVLLYLFLQNKTRTPCSTINTTWMKKVKCVGFFGKILGAEPIMKIMGMY